MNTLKYIILLFFISIQLFGQFPGAAGTLGSTAMHKDSSAFVAWANNCTVLRGYQDISNPTLGHTDIGDNTSATNNAGEHGVVSLGDGGIAILTFQNPISNGVGFDFAVFENAFDDYFLELAFVEVSSDGINFFRFPATSTTQTNTQIGPWDYVGDPTKINNLAGKYKALYGTPFDLQELDGINGLNINAVTHIKIIDVVGSINPLYATYDKNNNAINDPFPTGFPNGGFDLDAVGVINQLSTSINEKEKSVSFLMYPNPAKANQPINVVCDTEIEEISVYKAYGQIVFNGNVNNLKQYEFENGIYFLQIKTKNGLGIQKLIIQ